MEQSRPAAETKCCRWGRSNHRHVRACVLSCFSRVQLFAALQTVDHQAPLSMRILQARIWKWVAMPFSRGSSRHRDQTNISYLLCIGKQAFFH